MPNHTQGRRDRTEPSKPKCSGLRTEIHPVDEAIPAAVKETFVNGVVTDCLRLNVRREPNLDSEVLAVIDLLSEVVVDVSASTNEFYKITTVAGIEGFCLKKHIALPQ